MGLSPLCDQLHFAKGEFPPIVTSDLGGSSRDWCNWMGFWRETTAFATDRWLEADSHSNTLLCLKFGAIVKLMRQKLATDPLVASAHHHCTTIETRVLPYQFKLI